jgi:hypothetical protein
MKEILTVIAVGTILIMAGNAVALAEQHENNPMFSEGSNYEYACADSETELVARTSVSPKIPLLTPSTVTSYNSVDNSDVGSNSLNTEGYESTEVSVGSNNTVTLDDDECLVYVGSVLFGLGDIESTVLSVENRNSDKQNQSEDNNVTEQSNSNQDNTTSTTQMETASDNTENNTPEVRYTSKGVSAKGTRAPGSYSEDVRLESMSPTVEIEGSVAAEGLGMNLTMTRVDNQNGKLVVNVDFVEDGYGDGNTRYDYGIEVVNPENYDTLVVQHRGQRVESFSLG